MNHASWLTRPLKTSSRVPSRRAALGFELRDLVTELLLELLPRIITHIIAERLRDRSHNLMNAPMND